MSIKNLPLGTTIFILKDDLDSYIGVTTTTAPYIDTPEFQGYRINRINYSIENVFLSSTIANNALDRRKKEFKDTVEPLIQTKDQLILYLLNRMDYKHTSYVELDLIHTKIHALGIELT